MNKKLLEDINNYPKRFWAIDPDPARCGIEILGYSCLHRGSPNWPSFDRALTNKDLIKCCQMNKIKYASHMDKKDMFMSLMKI